MSEITREYAEEYAKEYVKEQVAEANAHAEDFMRRHGISEEQILEFRRLTAEKTRRK